MYLFLPLFCFGIVAVQGTVVELPTSALDDVKFKSTTFYHWERFHLNSTGEFEETIGPFSFGYATKLSSDQCLIETKKFIEDDECIKNPKNCPGLSFSLYYKPDYSHEDAYLADHTASFEKEYIFSTGGDIGTPGVALYREGPKMVALVSTGGYTWKLEVLGHIPPRDKWTNIGVRWRPLSGPEYGDLPFGYTPKDDEEALNVGGLALYFNLDRLGYAITPLECQNTLVCPENSNPKDGLRPPEAILGCHRTDEDPQKRLFASGEFDEVAIWEMWLNDTVLPYFMGGYQAMFEGVPPIQIYEMLQTVDTNDVAQTKAAIDVLLSGLAIPIEIEEPELAQDEAATPEAEADGEAEPEVDGFNYDDPYGIDAMGMKAKKAMTLIRMAEKLAHLKLDGRAVFRSEFDVRFDAVMAIGEILNDKGKYKDHYASYHKHPTLLIDAHKPREDFNRYLMELAVNRMGYGEFFEFSKTNMAASIMKKPYEEYKKLNSEAGFFQFPDWSRGQIWGGFMKALGEHHIPVDNAIVPTTFLKDRCDCDVISLVQNIYDSFPDQGRKNPGNVPVNRVVLDSRIISLNVELRTSDGEVCKPIYQDKYNIRLHFALKSGKNKVMRVSDGSRQLLFHNEETKTVKRKFCARWNDSIGTLGAWDSSDIVLDRADDTTASCTATRFGTFAIVSEIYEAPRVDPEETWLMVTKYLGYILSIILLTIFSIAIVASKHLREMFHFLALNLSIAMIMSNILMMLSDCEAIREDRHACFVISTGIAFFYVATSALLTFLVLAMFLATTVGIIEGYTEVYLCFAWGLAFMEVGISVTFHLEDLGDDPRCMIGWANEVKAFFWTFVLAGAIISVVLMLIVVCNISVSAMRKKTLVEEFSTLAYGLMVLSTLFLIAWIMYYFAYMRFIDSEVRDFYPAFTVLNSWMGIFAFVGVGLGSQRFTDLISGGIKARKFKRMENETGQSLDEAGAEEDKP